MTSLRPNRTLGSIEIGAPILHNMGEMCATLAKLESRNSQEHTVLAELCTCYCHSAQR
jgi:hypothetical protein